MRIPVRALVPFAVLALTIAALASGFQSGSVEARAAASMGGELSARGLWADARGNTVLVSERLAFDDSDHAPAVELRFFDAMGRTAWMLTLGEGSVTSLVEDHELLYLALAQTAPAADAEVSTTLFAVAMDSGQMRWKLQLDGEVTDLLADGAGGLRARSLRMEPGAAAGEHLLSLRDGVLLWDVALND